jgi:hypothetical protein
MEDPNLLVFWCRRAASGSPISNVYHDHNGDWQFLCDGSEHDDAEQIQQVHLKHIVARDPETIKLVNLLRGQHARRTAIGEKWKVFRLPPGENADSSSGSPHAVDCPCCLDKAEGAQPDESGLLPSERHVLEDIEKFGWHIWQVSPGATDDGFSYSVGMNKTLGFPDVIVFGQKTKWQGDMINLIGREVREGRRFAFDEPVGGLIPDYKCILKPASSLQTFMYYATWVSWYQEHHLKSDEPTQVVQLVWPDKEGRFPWDEGWDGGYLQPVLW